MSERDYRSYNVLEEELAAEDQTNKEQDNVIEANNLPKETIVSNYLKQEELIEKMPDGEGVCTGSLDIKEEKQQDNAQIQEENIFDEVKGTSSYKKQQDKNRYNQDELQFPAYKRYYQQKERSSLFKWLMLLGKIIITLMLLPLIGVITFGLLCVIGAFVSVIVSCIIAGLIVLGSICFLATQISGSVIALGLAISITVMSFGGIILILFLAIIKWSIKIFRKYKKPRIRTNNREVN